jgi:type I restriction enzyme, R subunit
MPKPLPVSVLEAKKEGEDPLKGMQQAKGYADCQRFEVKYVFATNGHRYGEFDFFTNLQGPFPFPDFPRHPDLTARYAKDTGIDITSPSPPCCFRPTARPGRSPATTRTPPSALPSKKSSSAASRRNLPACC